MTICNDRGTVPVVLEGVRKPAQMDEIQNAIGHRYVRHVHLSVDRATQKERFMASKRVKDSALSFEEAVNDASERRVEKLERIQFTPVHILRQRNSFGIRLG